MNPETLPLRDIHLPDPVGWWPPAPGWWLLVLGLVVLAFIARHVRRRRRPGATVGPAAARELATIRADYERHGDPQRLAGELSVLLRRFALTQAKRASVAGLTGDAWLAHLDTRAGAPLFSEGPGRALLDAPYRAAVDFDAPGLIGACAKAIEGPAEGRT